jgi:rare lipoprotein A
MRIVVILLLAASMTATAAPWERGTVTVYARKFEGRKAADGSRFTHRSFTAATCRGRLGDRYIIRYGRRQVVVRVTDRGRLRPGQFDTTKAVAKRLGLYRLTSRGKTDRRIMFRRIGK